MGKKQIRVTNPETRAIEFIDKIVSIVLSDNTVVTGTLMKVEKDNLIVQNMRLKKCAISLSKIVEFYTDIDA